MIDYNYGQPLADELNTLGRRVRAKTIIDYGFSQNAEDSELIRATNRLRCILLTRDKNTIDERSYKPCTHGGIIIIRQPRATERDIRGYIKAFCESGQRAHAIHGVTHLYKDRAIIHTHDAEPLVVSF